jgi:putative DNA primase/helicase
VGRFTPRQALARYLQKALGYSLTGSTREQKFFIAIGDGSNGKGVVFDTVKEILGPYAVTLPSDAFLVTSRGVDAERPTALAASLAGARFVVSSETRVGQKLDIGVIKNHTGDKEMTARRMRENPITFAITHKPWLQTNVRPGIDHMDPATRGRLHLIPFDRRWNRPGEPEHNPALPDGDKGLAAQLAGEAEGILAWLVRGVVMYQREGLTPPLEVVAMTRDYILEQDSFGRWLATLQRCAPKQGTRASELLKQYDGWCRAEGLNVGLLNATTFATTLRKHDIESAKCEDGTRYGLTGGMTFHQGVDPRTLGFGMPVPAPPIVPTPPPNG